MHIFIINKRSLKKFLIQHSSLFEDLLGEDFTPEQFIAKLEEGDFLPSLLNNDEMLLGLLLGFGEESSRAFKKIRPLCTPGHVPPPTDTYHVVEVEKPKGCKITPIVFMGNSHSPEVQRLISIYETELKEIWQRHKQAKDPLKMVLESLCAE